LKSRIAEVTYCKKEETCGRWVGHLGELMYEGNLPEKELAELFFRHV
jgi:hypothetical protein